MVDAKSDLSRISVASGVHHIGVSVASRDDALAFWESSSDGRRLGERGWTGRISVRSSASPALRSTAHSSIFLAASSSSFLNIRRRTGLRPAGDGEPGQRAHLPRGRGRGRRMASRRRLRSGARPPRGSCRGRRRPEQGARVAYLRIHDGVTLEVVQRLPAARAEPA